MENARLMATIRLGRFAECEAVAQRAGIAIERVLRPDLAYPVWINAASALACAGDLAAALRCADRGIAATRGVPVVALPCLAARAHLLARLGRHDEAAGHRRGAAGHGRAARLGADARHGAPRRRARRARRRAASARRPTLLVAALDGEAAVSRPAARLAAAEALALCGDADRRPPPSCVAPRWSRSGRVTRRGRSSRAWPGCRAWSPGPAATRPRRDGGSVESAEGWRRRGGTTSRQVGDEYMATLVDLGRPPVVGLVEPDRELARVVAELAELEEAGCPSSR